MSVGKSEGFDEDDPFPSPHMLMILRTAAVTALLAAVPVWALFFRVLSGFGGSLIPVSAAVATGLVVFWILVHVLRRNN